MKKRKSQKTRNTGGLFSRLRHKGPKPSRSDSGPSSWTVRLKVAFAILAWTCVGAAVSVGFLYLHRYIRTASPAAQNTAPLQLADVPQWLESEWVETITKTAGGRSFPLDDQSARQVAQRLQTLSWMDEVRVRTTPNALRVEARYRKPAARVQIGSGRQVYLDEEGVVLDALPLRSIHLVEIRGLPAQSIPPAGALCRAEEAAAALKLIQILQKMDQKCCPNQPLLHEIASIDVSNLTRQKSSSKPQIVLLARDGTPIHWGAPYGRSAVFLEADETDKLTTLYNFYIQNHYTLQGKARFIELRTPLTRRPRPR